jgi:RimJ/RimL family protein N-acetyltransferase
MKVDLKQLFDNYPHKPFPAPYGIALENVTKYWSFIVDRARKADETQPILYTELNGSLQGAALLEPSDWESHIYGLSMAKISLILAIGNYQVARHAYEYLVDQILERASQNKFDHITCRAITEDVALIHALEHAGFLHMDTTIEYVWKPELLTEDPPATWQIRLPKPDDMPALLALAGRTFTEITKTRYAVDPHLPMKRTEALYQQWLIKACEGVFADVVLVAEEDGAPIGFQMLKIERDLSEILGMGLATFGIGAIAPEKKGEGIFPSLLRALVRWAAERTVQVATGRVLVHNRAMHKACLRSGAFTGAAFHTFHKTVAGCR